MRIYYWPLVLSVITCLAADVYIYRAALKRCAVRFWSKVQLYTGAILYMLLLVALCMPKRGDNESAFITVMWMLFVFVSVYASKFLFVIVDLSASLPMLFHRSRLRAVSILGGVLAAVVFVLMWWGALINRFHTQIREVDVEIYGLPEQFDGYRMVQFSDFHVGTYGSDTTYVSHVVDCINAVGGDVILFTGDIVNRRTIELQPFVKPLSRLKARDGVYSILGNHDYGDYFDWSSDELKLQNMELMDSLQKSMGWNLLRNEYVMLHCGSDSIALIGVENVGDPPFAVYGSLERAYPALGDSVSKVLLTHNPAHWTSDIANNDTVNIGLSLSGHTHAMQIELWGVSPAIWRYPTWGGLYKDNESRHQMYVNIGIGAVALPMRIGATPEITVITLHPAK